MVARHMLAGLLLGSLVLDVSIVDAKVAAPSSNVTFGQRLRARREAIGRSMRRLVQEHPRKLVAGIGTLLFGGGLYAFLGHDQAVLGSTLAVSGFSMLASQFGGVVSNTYVRRGRLGIYPVENPTAYVKNTLALSTLAGGLFGLSALCTPSDGSALRDVVKPLATIGAFVSSGVSMVRAIYSDGVRRR